MANQLLSFFATCPKGIADLLADELHAIGAKETQIKIAGVIFSGDLELGLRACLWSRLANRILLPLATFAAGDVHELYHGVQQINWSKHLMPFNTMAVDFSSQQSNITHTQFGAQKVKDAIVDQLRAEFGERPNVQAKQPDVQVNVYLNQNIATLSIDLSGDSLHKRGFRMDGGDAPLKENLAAALLIRAGWPMIAAQGGALVDLMCGSATLPMEAALMAGNIAPGLSRDYFGFLKWRQHQPSMWDALIAEAKAAIKPITSPIVGYDADGRMIQQGILHVARANLSQHIHLEKRELASVILTEQLKKHPGLVIANPPYGERMGESSQLTYLYKNIGEKFKTIFTGWRGAIFTGNPDLGKTMGLRAHKLYALFNGAIPCKLITFAIESKYFVVDRSANKTPQITSYIETLAADDPILMFVHRVQKNMKHLERWAERENVFCYRLYDADLPEYAVAIDRYENWIQVQEYAAPKTVDAEKAELRLQKILNVLPEVFNLPAANIFLKIKRRQKRELQHQKLDNTEELLVVREGEGKFLVNLTDYVDAGLFLDQRITRAMIQKLAKNQHFLNLFAYTGAATVYAAQGGASSTTTVDMSAPYLQWAKKNLALNGFAEQKHNFIQADCLQWLKEEKRQYDLIYLEPPTFSNSKRMEETFDVERDHVDLLKQTLRLLTKEGKLFFATNKRNFHLDLSILKDYKVQDLSKKTLPEDFKRSSNSHYCWLLEVRT